MRRVVIPNIDLTVEHINIPRKTAHYLLHVLRCREGTQILIANGQGIQGKCIIESVRSSSSTVIARVYEISQSPKPEIPELHLIQSLPKGQTKIDEIIRRATELGVTSIRPALTSRSIPRLEDDRKIRKTLRWEKIATEASRQCNRNHIPKIFKITTLSQALEEKDERTTGIILWENEVSKSLKWILKAIGKSHGVTIAIGPEGGFEQEEILQAQKKGFHVASLGQHILRVETATIAALAIVQYELDAFDPPIVSTDELLCR